MLGFERKKKKKCDVRTLGLGAGGSGKLGVLVPSLGLSLCFADGRIWAASPFQVKTSTTFLTLGSSRSFPPDVTFQTCSPSSKLSCATRQALSQSPGACRLQALQPGSKRSPRKKDRSEALVGPGTAMDRASAVVCAPKAEDSP